MVEFELGDYNTLLRWMELAFARIGMDKMSKDDLKTFWKLTFLCEDKIREEKMNLPDDQHK